MLVLLNGGPKNDDFMQRWVLFMASTLLNGQSSHSFTLLLNELVKQEEKN